MKTVVVSLFAGMGGFDLAARWMGWDSVVVCEIDPLCHVVLGYHFPGVYIHGDVKTLTGDKINEEIEKRYGSRDSVRVVLCGGFPCQPYSAAGKRLGKEDDRHLWPEMLRIVRECQPEAIVGENVSGIVSWSGGLVFEEVQADLEVEGYEVQPVVLPACGVGAPHRRDRVWFVANRNGLDRHANIGRVNEKQGEEVFGKKQSTYSAGIGHQDVRPTPHADDDGCSGSPVEANDDRSHGAGSQEGCGDSAHCQKRAIESDVRVVTHAPEQGRKERVEAHGRKVSKEAGAGLVYGAERFGGVRVACKPYDINGDLSGLCASEVSQFGTSGVRGNYDHWENFPIESPLCDGDDGIPRGLGKLGFVVGGKKLTRSMLNKAGIKMGGNAVVPKVVLQIFRALEDTWGRFPAFGVTCSLFLA